MNRVPSGGRKLMSAMRSPAALGAIVVVGMVVLCLGTLPYTCGRASQIQSQHSDAVTRSPRRFEATHPGRAMLPPWWALPAEDERAQADLLEHAEGRRPRPMFGTDRLGRSVAVRVLAGGGVSLAVGFSAAAIAVAIGTAYGTIAGWVGGRTDAVLMRIVDILYGLPYILLVVLLAVAAGGLIDRANQPSEWRIGWLQSLMRRREAMNLLTLLVAIGGVSWLTMARVIRGQVLSLKQQQFMEACRAIGVPLRRQFFRHLLPNLLGPIIVYATLTVPTAILSESFLSFLGIGVQEPLPSWGNLAASGLSELNPVRARWWLLLWPCLFIAATLLALNFMGEGLRERFDPKRVK